ncbi:MAG: hypothetical protein RSD85_03760 [Erysipelotrichaceae bacterium]
MYIASVNFLDAPGMDTIKTIIFALIFIAILWWIFQSAKASLKKSGGKISSIFDEILIGVVALVCFIIVSQMSASAIFSFMSKPVTWIVGLILDFLRFIGIPV